MQLSTKLFIGLLLLLLFSVSINYCTLSRYYETRDLYYAATDSLRVTIDKKTGEEVATKQALTALPSKSQFERLPEPQRKLVERVRSLKKPKQVAGAVLTRTVATVSVLDTATAATPDSLVFERQSDTLSYSIVVYPTAQLLHIDSLTVGNEQFIELRETSSGTYVTVRNTNPMIHTTVAEAFIQKKKKLSIWKILFGWIIK